MPLIWTCFLSPARVRETGRVTMTDGLPKSTHSRIDPRPSSFLFDSVGDTFVPPGIRKDSPNPRENSVGNLSTLPGLDKQPLGRIDRYELLEGIGGGAFGVVFRARDTVANIDVAVKGLQPLIQNNREEMEKIRQNFALISQLHHPSIAAPLVLHQVQTVSYKAPSVRRKLRVQEGDYLFEMTFAPGVTLSCWRKQFPEGKVPVGKALDICRHIADGLDYAHSQKIIHRDIKPSNIMVETRLDGRLYVQVLDFGLAAEIRSSMNRVSHHVGDTSGTRPFMAPEQWQGLAQGPYTDQYALAVLFYDLVSGAVPFATAFETGDPLVMMNAVLHEKPLPLPFLRKSQNKALLKALSKEPKLRFRTCTDFVEGLNRTRSRIPLSIFPVFLFLAMGGRYTVWRYVIPTIIEAEKRAESAMVEETRLFQGQKYSEVEALYREAAAAYGNNWRDETVADKGRNQAVEARNQAEKAQKEAEEANAEKYAKDYWDGAGSAMNEGDRRFKDKKYSEAGESYSKAAAAYQESRNKAVAVNARNQAVEARKEAEKANADRIAGKSWKEGNEKMEDAEKDYKKGNYSEATNKWKEAENKFKEAKNDASKPPLI